MAYSQLKIQIVVALAGKSSRFKEKGILIPKPLIPIRERPMVTYALDSVEPLLCKSQLFGIVCAEDSMKPQIEEIFSTYARDARVCEIPERTLGPAQTILSISGNLDPEAPLLILDGDLHFKSSAFLNGLLSEPLFTALPGGSLVTFSSTNPAYSYVREGANQAIIQIAEKRVISHSALAGAYHFRAARDFISTATRMVTFSPNREHYISQVIAEMLDDGADFRHSQAELHFSFGTPEELSQSERLLI